LSGGERNRLALCKLVLAEPEILILDEPTNHLDIASIEALENALQNFAGTIIVVSHDRFFLNKVVEQLLILGVDELGRKQLGRYELLSGSFSQYAQILDERRQAKQGRQEKTKSKKQTNKPKDTTPRELLQFAMWSYERLEEEIEKTEKQIMQLTEQFGNPEVYKNQQELELLREQMHESKLYLGLLYRAYERKIEI